MLINEVIVRINASYNTVRKQVLNENKYHEMKNKTLYVTQEGYKMLEEKYGLRAEIISEENIHFYKGQITLLQNQIEFQVNQFRTYQNQIEQQQKANQIYLTQLENLQLKEKEIVEENQRLKKELEESKNRTLLKRILNK